MRRVFFIFALVMAFAATAQVRQAPPAEADPELEKHVTAISEKLRCLVCQNQTIADSQAGLAIDLKNQVRDMLAQGKSDQEVIDYMVQRYGDFVLYQPVFKTTTWLLWIGPFLLLIGGLILLSIRLRRASASTTTLSEADQQRAARLLDADSKETK